MRRDPGESAGLRRFPLEALAAAYALPLAVPLRALGGVVVFLAGGRWDTVVRAELTEEAEPGRLEFRESNPLSRLESKGRLPLIAACTLWQYFGLQLPARDSATASQKLLDICWCAPVKAHVTEE